MKHMGIETKSQVTLLLEIYLEREQKIAALRYELAHPAQVSSDELIGAMALGRGDGTGRSSGNISDKTLYIALNYHETANKVNTHIIDDIATHLVALEQEQNRLKYFVSLLEKRQAEVIRLIYFESYSQEEASQELGIVPRTTRRIKQDATKKLTELYSLVKCEKRRDRSTHV